MPKNIKLIRSKTVTAMTEGSEIGTANRGQPRVKIEPVAAIL